MKVQSLYNGNILELRRNDGAGNQFDNLTYTYSTSPHKSNRLRHITDAHTTAATHPNDLETQPTDNYTYDDVGNLTADQGANVTAVFWTPSNKIDSIVTTTRKIAYTYDAMGNRVRARSWTPSNTHEHTTWYIRDGDGQVLSIYKKVGTGGIVQTEVPLYGSDRLGMIKPSREWSNSWVDTIDVVERRTAGERYYELKDHLGNIRVVLTDEVEKPSANMYLATVAKQTDYYPFGMIMDQRSTSTAGYRYGYNGKENDNEVKGEGNQQDYGFRIYDPRVARFLSVDPLASQYPYYTPYQFAGNTPIQAIDLDGLEPFFVMGTFQSSEDTKNQQLRQSLRSIVTGLSLNNLNATPIDYGFSWNEIDKNGRSSGSMLDGLPRIKDFAREYIWAPGSNGGLNSESDRAIAAKSLAEYIARHHVPGQPVTIMGYSHGGNVAIQAAPLVREMLGPDVTINLVTLFTPAYNSGSTRENPRLISDKINAHFHFFASSDDVVTAGLGAHEYYKNFMQPSAINGAHDKLLQVNVDKHRQQGVVPAGHGSLYYPETIGNSTKALKSKQDESKEGE